MDPADCSCQDDMNEHALNSESESETESGSLQQTKKGELASNEKKTDGKELNSQGSSEEKEHNTPDEILLSSVVERDQRPKEKTEYRLNERRESLLRLKEASSVATRETEDQPSHKKKESEENQQVPKQIALSLPIIDEEPTLENKEESQPKEREDRPLVLEERHSLSIAETKKRRASVYCDGNLFIPKELARGELLRRRYSTSVNNLDPISRNRDYCIRMLKFPVGLGRARYVAQQLRRKRLKERKMRTDMQFGSHKEQKRNGSSSTTELSIKEEVLNIPNLSTEQADTNQLYSDDEVCIVLEEIVDEHVTGTEEDGTDELIDRVSKRQMRRASSLELRRSNADELLAEVDDQQQLSLFRWHMPNSSDNSIKMGVMEDLQNISLSANVEIQVGYSEVTETATVAQTEQQLVVEEVAEEVPQQQPLQTTSFDTVELQQHEANLQHFQFENAENTRQQQQHLQYIVAAPSRVPATTSISQANEPQVESLALRQHLMHRIILPPVHNEEFTQPNTTNNNAVSLLNQNLQQHFGEALLPSELMQQWTLQHYEKYAQTAPQQQQLSHSLQQQQAATLQQQQQYQTSYHEQQHLEARRGELQQLNAQYQRLKCQEDEQLKSINKTLKDVYADRLLNERQHAEYHRIFMHKMIESKKQEENLQYQKEQITRKLKLELDSLEQLIGEKRRKLQERNRILQWQAEQYQQQHYQQQQQLHKQQHHKLQNQQPQQHQQQHQHAFHQQHANFLQHLQPPSYQPRLQCFQDAFSQYNELQTTRCSPTVELHSGLMPPPVPVPVTAPKLPMPPDRRIMRRRHTIDHRASNMLYAHPTPTFPPPPQQHRQSPRRTLATATSVLPPAAPHFALPETPRITSERNSINQAIDQSAITSILTNYVTKYFNDLESRNS